MFRMQRTQAFIVREVITPAGTLIPAASNSQGCRICPVPMLAPTPLISMKENRNRPHSTQPRVRWSSTRLSGRKARLPWSERQAR
jgi:hypothetical protein